MGNFRHYNALLGGLSTVRGPLFWGLMVEGRIDPPSILFAEWENIPLLELETTFSPFPLLLHFLLQHFYFRINTERALTWWHVTEANECAPLCFYQGGWAEKGLKRR